MAHTGKLSAIEVAKAKGPAVLHDGGGLYLRVSATGAKSWVFRFQLDGKRAATGDHARIGTEEEKDTTDNLDHALDVEERPHRRASRREAKIFLQAMLDEQQSDDDTQEYSGRRASPYRGAMS
jgi:hypothetical protein